MYFWSGKEAQVFLFDGSPEPIKSSDLEQLDNNVNYFHLPISPFERLSYASKFVNTEYVIFLGDDEFFIPKALEECIKNLDSDQALVSCMGRAMGFDFKNSQIIGLSVYEDFENYSVLCENKFDRMISHMDPYVCSTIYSVLRTDVWKKSVDTICKQQFPPFNLSEVSFEMLVSYYGKSKVIPTLMWLRSFENKPFWADHEDSKNKNYIIENWWRDPKNKLEHESFVKIMSESLSDGEDVNELQLINNKIRESINAYVKGRARELPIHLRLRAKILSYLPKIVVEVLRYLKYKDAEALLSEKSLDLPNFAKISFHPEVDIDFDELLSLNNIILDFHK
jgi:glycosyltransferase domain-containing protein